MNPPPHAIATPLGGGRTKDRSVVELVVGKSTSRGLAVNRWKQDHLLALTLGVNCKEKHIIFDSY